MRRLLLILALVLLPSQAFAECAWVVWYTETRTSKGDPQTSEWSALEAFENRGECMQQAEAMLRDEEKHPNVSRMMPDTVVFEFGKVLWAMTYRCLPDTVDPRGKEGH